MPTPTVEECERELAALGKRRRELKEEEKELQQDTRNALRKAKGVVPTARAAKLAGLNRSTVYELYLPGGDEDAASRSRRKPEEPG